MSRSTRHLREKVEPLFYERDLWFLECHTGKLVLPGQRVVTSVPVRELSWMWIPGKPPEEEVLFGDVQISLRDIKPKLLAMEKYVDAGRCPVVAMCRRYSRVWGVWCPEGMRGEVESRMMKYWT